MMITQVPLRISLLGGGTDLPEFFSKYGSGETLGFAFNSYTTLIAERIYFNESLKYRLSYRVNEDVYDIKDIKHPIFKYILSNFPLPGQYHISSKSAIPSGSGVGSSSSFTVALYDLVHRIRDINLSNFELAAAAVDIERLQLREAGGFQDQYLVSHPGLNSLKFRSNSDVSVCPIPFNSAVKTLNDHLYLLHTNIVRVASYIESSKIIPIDDFNDLVDLARTGKEMLLNDSFLISDFSKLITESWIIKRSLSSNISNSEVDFLVKLLIDHEVFGVKLCGAGAGGVLLVIAEADIIERITKKYSLNFLKIGIDFNGIRRF